MVEFVFVLDSVIWLMKKTQIPLSLAKLLQTAKWNDVPVKMFYCINYMYDNLSVASHMTANLLY